MSQIELKEKKHLLLQKYVRRVPPVLEEALKTYLLEELRNIEAVLKANEDGIVETTDRLPKNPRIGMLRYLSKWKLKVRIGPGCMFSQKTPSGAKLA